ncbi:energy transducer TonB family protein [Roseovarius amoyensis]|uniref:energy transducer TonB family protein n=1 Tax=Roseovarius amoyensis TaxID=2211448 RepID=UPI000DBE6C90|nr:energy transducer TonB [Roseovarius amoyensis]
MKRAAEFAVFALLAAALHVAVAGLAPSSAGVEAAGQTGEALSTLHASDAALAALVERWDTPPEETPTPRRPVETPPEPDAPPPLPEQSVRPELETAARRPDVALPRADSLPYAAVTAPPPALPAPPPQFQAHVALPASPDAARDPDAPLPEADRPPERADPARPLAAAPPDVAPPPPPAAEPPARRPPVPEMRPRPAPQPQAQAPSRASAAQRAQGQGGGQSAGASTRPANAATLSASQRSSLTARWGAELRRRVEARKRYPRDGRRASGTVTVRMTVNRGGGLVSASVARGSGNAALDRAALSAVRAAGRFPPAPTGLTEASYTFTLPMRFSPR